MIHSIQISQHEFNQRCQALLAYARAQNLNGVVLFDNVNILYFTGFAFIPTERPIAFALSAGAERAMYVPRLEIEHAQAETGIDRVEHYFQPGDVLVTGAGCPMWGYNSELERTMFVGEPDRQKQALFNHMKAAQETTFAAMKPGRKCSDVDAAVRSYYEKHNLMPYWKHHTGHAIGLRYHEGPFLDPGDETALQTGMVFTVEPGLYAPDLGGFRHSDTVALTTDGIEILTYYPRDWQNLIIPA